MRVYVVIQEKKTTISLDEQLWHYLQRRLAKNGIRGDKDKTARLWVQQLVDGAGDLLPSKGVSQWIQARIIDAIADPGLKDDVTLAAEEELKGRIQALMAQRQEEWCQRDEERHQLTKQREHFEAIARKLAEKTPHYKRSPKILW